MAGKELLLHSEALVPLPPYTVLLLPGLHLGSEHERYESEPRPENPEFSLHSEWNYHQNPL